ncbi:MAG: DUF2092 domain-containing protein [Dehalococcoidia bacterium]
MSKRRAIVAGGLLGAIVAAALGVAVGPVFGQTPSADQIARRVAEQSKNTTSVHATVSVATNDSRIGGPLVVEVWTEKPAKGRAEVRQTPLSDLSGALAVTDGQTAYLYAKSKNQVIVASRTDLETMAPKDRLPHQAMDLNAAVDELFKQADVKLLGSETIDGVAAYKLEVSPKPGTITKPRGPATVWIDRARNIPVKAVLPTDQGVLTISAKDVKINSKLDAALWSFSPPAGAEVIRAADLKPQPLTPDEARAMASVKVLIPESLPTGARLVGIERVGPAVVQKYELGDQEFSIWSGPASQAPTIPGRDAEKVALRGTTATIHEAAGITSLTWTENGFAYAIAGGLSRDDALRLAASLK